tara:strand:+ start:704 stop:1141 length:438 start_codon:yes stop_codon:yes gene_type:complete
MSNILEQANKIINERSEEKERQYGPMGEGFERAAMIASGMSGRTWDAHDMFIAMVALKFSRQSYNFKEDNLLDAVAYIGAWQNYINETKPEFSGSDSKEEVSSMKLDPYHLEEEDTQDGPIAESPYAPDHPRSVLSALIKLGDTK